MIDKLTDRQEEQLAEYRDRWIKVGLATGPMDQSELREDIDWLYGVLERDLGVPITVKASPLAAGLEANTIAAKEQAADDGVGLPDDWEPGEVVWPYLWGHLDVGYVSFYSYIDEVLGVGTEQMRRLSKLSRYGPIWPLEKHCVVSDRPVHIKKNESGLHCDGGSAVEYSDGFAVWALNGVRVPRWLAETNAQEIDPLEFAKQDNVEVRREFVRKVGMERIVKHVGAKSLDTHGDYELLMIDLGGETGEWPYLKMRNPSIGVWHIECVGKECRTVQDAINFRASELRALNGDDWNPEVLT